jgi:hypothetical protein
MWQLLTQLNGMTPQINEANSGYIIDFSSPGFAPNKRLPQLAGIHCTAKCCPMVTALEKYNILLCGVINENFYAPISTSNIGQSKQTSN